MDHAHDAPPPQDEPKTPLAFTLLGIGLLLLGAIVWIARSPEEAADTEPAAKAADSAP